MRDFLYIDDAGAALAALLDTDVVRGPIKPAIGSGAGTPVRMTLSCWPPAMLEGPSWFALAPRLCAQLIHPRWSPAQRRLNLGGRVHSS